MNVIKYFPVRSVVWAIVGFMAALFIFAILYVSLGWPALAIINQFQQQFNLGDNANNVLEFLKYTFLLSGIIVVIGLIMWLYINTRKPEWITHGV